MRKLILFLAAVSLVLSAEKALCYETTFSIEPESFNSFRYHEMRVEEAAPLSIRTGRFLSVDPVINVDRLTQKPQGWNRYAYVSNNPVNAVDPDGRDEYNMMRRQLGVEDDWEGRDKQHVTVLVTIGSLFRPGPEDVVMGAFALKFGGRLLMRAIGKADEFWILRSFASRRSRSRGVSKR